MDPVHLAIAFVPLGLYLVFVGAVHCRRRPVVISGATDVTLLAMAVLGLVVVGPMEFLFPTAVPFPGLMVWMLLLLCYSLLITLWNLLARPRLVVLNAAIGEMRLVLAEVGQRLDKSAQWAGDSLALPEVGLQLHIEEYAPMRTVSLIATGERQSEIGWKRLHDELAATIGKLDFPDRRRGFALTALGVCMLVWPLGQAIAMGGPMLAQNLRDLLRM